MFLEIQQITKFLKDTTKPNGKYRYRSTAAIARALKMPPAAVDRLCGVSSKINKARNTYNTPNRPNLWRYIP